MRTIEREIVGGFIPMGKSRPGGDVDEGETQVAAVRRERKSTPRWRR